MDTLPKQIQKAFEEYESNEPSTNDHFAIPPREVTATAKKFLYHVDWNQAPIPNFYTYGSSLVVEWRDVLGLDMNPDGIDVYRKATDDGEVFEGSLEKALTGARKLKPEFFKITDPLGISSEPHGEEK